jgi:DNA polymerase I
MNIPALLTQFGDVILCDFEFWGPDGSLKEPVCVAWKSLRTGYVGTLWRDQFGAESPFPVSPGTLFVAYNVEAELQCFLQLGWDLPVHVLDLLTEHRHETNMFGLKDMGRTLPNAMTWHGLTAHVSKDEKKGMQQMVLQGGPWTSQQIRDILEYCAGDVYCLEPLLERMLPGICSRPHGLAHAVIRGRYMVYLTVMQRAGLPMDTRMLSRIREHRHDILVALIRDFGPRYPVFEGTTFKDDLFCAFLNEKGWEWEFTPSGRPKTDKEFFKEMVLRYPEAEGLHQLLATMRQLKNEKLAVGPDARNRASLFPFKTLTSRHAPRASQYILSQPAWMRGLIQPSEGNALACIDWSSQEICIVAMLANDVGLLKLIEQGDPYIATAIAARMVPQWATKQSHGRQRDMCKVAMLGIVYGMQAPTLMKRTGLSLFEARELLDWMRRTFPEATQWGQDMANTGQLSGELTTRLGWVLQARGHTTRTLRNFCVQANGAEVLRHAICQAIDHGVTVCAQLHDSIFIEAGADDIHDAVATARAAMAKGCAIVLDGMEIDTDAQIMVAPQRYLPAKGQPLWRQVTDYLDAFDEDITVQ